MKYNSKSDFLYLDENSEYLFIAECEDIGQLSLKIKDEDKYSIFYSELTHTDKFIKIAENFTDFINGFSYPFANELEEFCYYPNTNKLLEIIRNKDLSVYKDYYRDSFADFIFEGNLNNDALFIILEALFNSGYSIKGYMNYIINRKDVKLLELCVKNGENINEKDNFNDSLINLAVRNLDLETIKFLLRNKIDLNTKNNNNETTIDLILDKKKNDKYLNEENLSKCDEILELLNNYLN